MSNRNIHAYQSPLSADEGGITVASGQCTLGGPIGPADGSPPPGYFDDLKARLSVGYRPTIEQIRAKNRERSRVWHAGAKPWTVSDWATAFAGEAGEVCDAVKKLRRAECNMAAPGLKHKPHLPRHELVAEIAKECADTFLYLDLLCEHLGIDLELALKSKFNEVSEKYGFEQRL